MTIVSSMSEFETLERFVDHLATPTFLVDVDGQSYRYRRLNPAYEEMTGVSNAAIHGRTPEEAFPKRVAESFRKSLDICRDTVKPLRMEELVELNNGQQWFWTVFTPVTGPTGRVDRIVGQLTEITQLKEREFEATAALGKIGSINDDLQIFTSMAVRDMRGPFQTMLGLLNLIKDGFLDLGDEKVHQIELCQSVAEEALQRMDRIVARSEGLEPRKDRLCDIDFGQMCSDVTAIVDPDHRFNIRYPSRQIRADRVALQLIIRSMIENAMHYCDREIALDVMEAQEGGEMLGFTVFDDGAGASYDQRCDGTMVLPEAGSADCAYGLGLARELVEQRNGKMRQQLPRNGPGVEIGFTLPGKLCGEGARTRVVA